MNSAVITHLDIADRHIQDYPRAIASQADDLPLCAKADVQTGSPERPLWGTSRRFTSDSSTGGSRPEAAVTDAHLASSSSGKRLLRRQPIHIPTPTRRAAKRADA